MKKLATLSLIGAASALALSATAASARPYHHGWVSIDHRQAQLDRRIDRGIRNGSLDRREAYRLRGEFRQIARLEYRYRANGLSRWERADLDRRFDRLASRVRWERHDQYGYGYGYGYGRR